GPTDKPHHEQTAAPRCQVHPGTTAALGLTSDVPTCLYTGMPRHANRDSRLCQLGASILVTSRSLTPSEPRTEDPWSDTDARGPRTVKHTAASTLAWRCHSSCVRPG